MKKLTNRTRVEVKEDESNLFIYPVQDKKGNTQLTVWLVLFTIVGLATMIGAPSFVSSREEFAIVFIYLAFWLYFELKVLGAFLYRKFGEEHVQIKDGHIHYVLRKRGRGLTKSYPLKEVTDITYNPKSASGFFGMINQAAWMIAGEGIEITMKDKKQSIGIQLKQGESDKVIAWLKKQIKKQQS